MAIQVIGDRIFQIETEHTCYQIQADRHNIVAHLWYGPKTGGQVMDYLQDYPDVGFAGSIADAGNDRTYSLDTRLQEYPCEGTGDYRISAAGLEAWKKEVICWRACEIICRRLWRMVGSQK